MLLCPSEKCKLFLEKAIISRIIMQLSILVLMEDNYLLHYKLLIRCGSTIKFLLADYKAFHYHSHDCWGLCRSQNFAHSFLSFDHRRKIPTFYITTINHFITLQISCKFMLLYQLKTIIA